MEDLTFEINEELDAIVCAFESYNNFLSLIDPDDIIATEAKKNASPVEEFQETAKKMVDASAAKAEAIEAQKKKGFFAAIGAMITKFVNWLRNLFGFEPLEVELTTAVAEDPNKYLDIMKAALLKMSAAKTKEEYQKHLITFEAATKKLEDTLDEIENNKNRKSDRYTYKIKIDENMGFFKKLGTHLANIPRGLGNVLINKDYKIAKKIDKAEVKAFDQADDVVKNARKLMGKLVAVIAKCEVIDTPKNLEKARKTAGKMHKNFDKTVDKKTAKVEKYEGKAKKKNSKLIKRGSAEGHLPTEAATEAILEGTICLAKFDTALEAMYSGDATLIAKTLYDLETTFATEALNILTDEEPSADVISTCAEIILEADFDNLVADACEALIETANDYSIACEGMTNTGTVSEDFLDIPDMYEFCLFAACEALMSDIIDDYAAEGIFAKNEEREKLKEQARNAKADPKDIKALSKEIDSYIAKLDKEGEESGRIVVKEYDNTKFGSKTSLFDRKRSTITGEKGIKKMEALKAKIKDEMTESEVNQLKTSAKILFDTQLRSMKVANIKLRDTYYDITSKQAYKAKKPYVREKIYDKINKIATDKRKADDHDIHGNAFIMVGQGATGNAASRIATITQEKRDALAKERENIIKSDGKKYVYPNDKELDENNKRWNKYIALERKKLNLAREKSNEEWEAKEKIKWEKWDAEQKEKEEEKRRKEEKTKANIEAKAKAAAEKVKAREEAKQAAIEKVKKIVS